MNLSANPIRKVYQGVADRRQMFRLFDRHAQRPNRWQSDDSVLYRGEWFEIGKAESTYMLDILPPLWIRADMFALSEFLTGSITSVFFTLTIEGRVRFFHTYCDLADRTSCERTREAIMARESRPLKAMTREECLEHIWSVTHDDYRGYAGEDFAERLRGRRFVLCYGRRPGATRRILEQLTDAEIAPKLPVNLRDLGARQVA